MLITLPVRSATSPARASTGTAAGPRLPRWRRGSLVPQSASPEAYESLLLDAMLGDATLFLRGDEVEASWRLIDRFRGVWDTTGTPPLHEYAPGSWGPPQADALLGDPYRRWIPS